ncbi:MAG: hypothetical protein ACP5OA_06295 [Candidatus Woesearchaeota archaeon]
MRCKGQVAIEFLMLIVMAFIVVMTLLIATLAISENNSETKAYREMDDLGKALQQEFMLASQLEDGYVRKINLPLTFSGKEYHAIVGQSNPTNGYLVLQYEEKELYYLIPPVNGSITLGDNILVKQNGTLRIN